MALPGGRTGWVVFIRLHCCLAWLVSDIRRTEPAALGWSSPGAGSAGRLSPVAGKDAARIAAGMILVQASASACLFCVGDRPVICASVASKRAAICAAAGFLKGVMFHSFSFSVHGQCSLGVGLS